MPNGAQVHLALNHLPAAITAAALLVLVIGLVWRNAAVLRTSFAVMLFAALLAIPAFYSGDKAEHLVEDLERVNEMAIHPHEEAGEAAFITMLVQGGIAILLLIVFRKRPPAGWAIALIVLASLVSSAALFRASWLGGKIQHPETQMTAPPEEEQEGEGGRGRGRSGR
ncbi:MAG TPA: hypothetical protein VGF48_11995 [Thermoanaerobaculia bacterium]|jgi:uncharacterized membrane protein